MIISALEIIFLLLNLIVVCKIVNLKAAALLCRGYYGRPSAAFAIQYYIREYSTNGYFNSIDNIEAGRIFFGIFQDFSRLSKFTG